MPFYPDGAAVPEELRTGEFLLRPLRGSDVELDYAALMDSTEMLRRWSQSGWPADDFSLAENLADLQKHEQEHQDRVAFTYTVLDPGGATCLGCVYILPAAPLLAAEEAELFAPEESYRARCTFWVRQPRIADDLDRRLLRVLLDWFDRDWAFSRVLFFCSAQDQRQAHILAEADLLLLLVKERTNADTGQTRRWLIYG